VWIVFGIWLYCSKYGKLKLCKKGEEATPPEFGNSTYFMMLFSCGVAVGMFFYGIAEPIGERHSNCTVAN
jgi:choline/glycine/proline betaine transport protein